MRRELLDILRCSETGQPFALEVEEERKGHVWSGRLVSTGNGRSYSIRNSIPQFVSEGNYADSFGMQWNRFRRTQLDSYSGQPISAGRFWATTGWKPGDIKGQWVLDAGCGAGRFAEVALAAGARVVAVDYSSAVQASYDNLQHYPDFHVIRASIYDMPVPDRFFPFVYSLGVLQHTPDVASAIRALIRKLGPRGNLALDLYPKNLAAYFLPKYWLRPLTKRVQKDRLFAFLTKAVPVLFRVSCAVQHTPVVGFLLGKAVPVANYTDILPLRPDQLLEWALLDTFDMFSPEYDKPQTAACLRNWLREEGLSSIDVGRRGLLIARARRPC